MFNNRRKVFAVGVVLLLVFTAGMANAEPRSSAIISWVSAGLNLNESATFTIVARVSCEELGTAKDEDHFQWWA